MKPYNFNLENFTNYNYIIENFSKSRNIRKFLGFGDNVEITPAMFKQRLAKKAISIGKKSGLTDVIYKDQRAIELGILNSFNLGNFKLKSVDGRMKNFNNLQGVNLSSYGDNVLKNFEILKKNIQK